MNLFLIVDIVLMLVIVKNATKISIYQILKVAA